MSELSPTLRLREIELKSPIEQIIFLFFDLCNFNKKFHNLILVILQKKHPP